MALGETEGIFVTGRANAGQADLFLLRLSAEGVLERAWLWGTTAYESASAIALDRCGRGIAVGHAGDGRRRRALTWFPPGR